MSLEPFDLATADLQPGTVLLEASAGTGKTYALVGILLRMLLEDRLERIDQALVVTFTIAATDELKTRLRAGLQRALAATQAADADPFFAGLGRMPGAAGKLRAAIASFDQVAIATIHGFCKRVLDEAAFESREPFQLEFAADPVVLLEQAAADALRAMYEPGATLRNQLLHDGRVTPKKLVDWYRLWQRHPDVRLQPDVADFDGLERAVAAALPAAVAAFDNAAARYLGGVRWRSGHCAFPDPAAVAAGLDHFAAALHTDPAGQVAVLAALARSQLQARLYQKSLPVPAHPFFDACEPIAAAHEARWPHLRAHLLQRMHDRVAGQKRAEHVLSFDDLLRRTHAALRDPQRGEALRKVLQARYRVALIDEFQDTDRLQYEVFATCFDGASWFLIGDPKQAIYGFRGADLRAYLAARDDAQRRYTLATNYRSSAPMVRAVHQLFARPFAFAASTIEVPEVRAKAPPGELTVADPQQSAALCWRFVPPASDADDTADGTPRDAALSRIAADVAAEIRRLLATARLPDGRGGERAVQPRDIAVLARRNAEAVLVQDTLRKANVASVIGKAGDIFATEEVDELDRFLQAVLQPGNLAAVRAALATRWYGLDAAALQALDADERALDVHLERLDRWRRLWHRSGFVPMVEQAMVDRFVVKRFLALQGGERRLTNFRQLFEMLHDAEHEGRRSPEGVLEWLRRERANQDDLDYTVRELRLESDGDAVQILTMHGSKGLEYEITFCPFLWGGVMPRTTEVVEADAGHHHLAFDATKGTDEHDRAMAVQLGEDLRLTYVALTRSRRRCYVHFGNLGKGNNGSWRSGLAWLLAPPALPAAADWPPAWATKWADASKAAAGQWRARLLQLVEASGGAMSLADVPDAPSLAALPIEPPAGLRPAERPGRLVRPRGMHSFTSIVANTPALDAPRDVADPPATATPPAPAHGIHAFARGAAAGQCLHEILEHTDFARLAPAATRAHVRATLAAHGLVEPGAHPGELDPVPTVVQMLHDLAEAQLPGGATLAALCGGARQAEWQFLLPAERAAVQTLATLFAQSGSAPAVAQAERLRALPATALRGFLVGFVDLVAEHDGRFWVLDWKSNHLGPDAAAYDDNTLFAAMLEHDYVLQYHLYVLALHRHLRLRLRGYDPARHLGGVCYVFLRGVRPGSTDGLFVDRVPPALVDGMDRWIAGGGAA